MKTVILTKVIDPDRKIRAIKALREATREPVVGGSAMGLIDAKYTVDALCGNGLTSGPRIAPSEPTAQEVEVHSTAELDGYFAYTAVETATVPAADVLAFVLDVLAWMDPDRARALMQEPSYQRIAEALR